MGIVHVTREAKNMRYSKYEAIPRFLETLGSDMVEVTLDDLAGAVGGLPQSAHTYQAWWSNNKASSAGRQCQMDGGRMDRASEAR
jgi:hypothetical protein